MKLSILIPAYQEERTIARVMAATLAVDVAPWEKEVIVIDDGSSDATSQEATRAAQGDARVRLLRHELNRGKGAAIRTGLAAATGDVCLIQDADDEYSIDDYRALLAPMAAGAAVVYGSRFLNTRWPQRMRPANFLANKLLTWTANLLYRQGISDEATCFKVFRTAVLRSLDLECRGFEFCPEVTAKLGLGRIPIVEVPVRYQARNIAEGKKVGWRDGIIAIGTLIRYRLPRRWRRRAASGE